MELMNLTKEYWKPCYRIIPSRFPAIYLYERVTNNEEFEILNEIEAMTNPKHRDEIGELTLVAPEDRIFGPGTSRIMAAFTHLNPVGSRFSDGTYGVYYAGKVLETAIRETKFHRERFLRSTHQKAGQTFDMLVLAADLQAELHDIRGKKEQFAHLYHSDPKQYASAQSFAKELKIQGSNGLLYDSVRHEGGECAAVFKPKVLKKCVDWKRLVYHWNGEKIDYSFIPNDYIYY